MTPKSDTVKSREVRAPKVRTWRLVTNHLNMLYMLAAGLVMGPAGFRGKHYLDSLSIYPGWIPLYADDKDIPADVLEFVTSERNHLVPCVATFDLSEYSGAVRLLKKSGKVQLADSQPKRRNAHDIAMLIPAPLPMNKLCSIAFRTSEDVEAFTRAAARVSNVGSYSHFIEVSESVFKGTQDVSSMASQPMRMDGGSDDLPSYGLALGGVLAMLYHLANRSDLGLSVYREITEKPDEVGRRDDQYDSVLAELPNWMNGNMVSGQADVRVRLFWGVVQSLIVSQAQDRTQSPSDVVLAYLDSQLDSLEEQKYVSRLQNLIADIRSLSGLGGRTISGLLEEHKGTFSRPVLLLVLREHCSDLLEFSHPSLSDTEYVLAGILLGVRDSWLQFPNQLRSRELVDYVAYRMVEAEYRRKGETFGMTAPPPPKPLREYFGFVRGEWSAFQERLAIDLAKKANWNDCIKTVVILPEGEFPQVFERKGQELVLPGCLSIKEEIDIVRFMERLGQWPPLDSAIESEVRACFEVQKTESAPHADDTLSASSDKESC